MGTRSTVKFYEDDEVLVCVYQQFDGYPEGVGKSLAEFLKPFRMVNGFNSDTDVIYKVANGMGCLAAQFIAHFKTQVGNLYISHTDDSQEYNYEVRLLRSMGLKVTVKNSNNKVLFNGSPDEMIAWIDKDDEVDGEEEE